MQLLCNNTFLAFNNEGNICDYIHVRFFHVIAIYALVDRPVPVILWINKNQRVNLMNSHYPDTTISTKVNNQYSSCGCICV